jgi:hypothetical protein
LQKKGASLVFLGGVFVREDRLLEFDFFRKKNVFMPSIFSESIEQIQGVFFIGKHLR